MFNLFILILFSLRSEANSLNVVTTDFPPFQYSENEKVKGITTEIVENIIANAGFEAKIRSYPWARALKLAEKERNILIYSIMQNPERDKKFKWIGEIAPFNVYFWKLKKRKDIKIHSILDVTDYKCGATAGDIKTDFLIKIGFVPGLNLDIVTTDQQNIRRLFAGKIDIMTHNEISFRESAKIENLDFSLVEKLVYMKGSSNQLQLAASLGTSDIVVEKLRASLKAFKKTKKYQKLRKLLK